MNVDEFDLQFLTEVGKPIPQKTPSEDSAHEQSPSGETPDLSFLLSDVNLPEEASVVDSSSLTEIDPQLVTAQSEKLLSDLGVSQAVDGQPLDVAQKWSMEPANEAAMQLDRNWPDNLESEPGVTPHPGEVKEEDLEFGPVPTGIDPPLILEGQDSLFGEDTDDDSQDLKVVDQSDPELSLQDMQTIESLVGSEEFKGHGETKSPFIKSEDPLALAEDLDPTQSYEALLEQKDENEPQVVHETMDLDLSALPGFADAGLEDASDEPPSEPMVVNEPMLVNNDADLSETPAEELLVLYSSNQADSSFEPQKEAEGRSQESRTDDETKKQAIKPPQKSSFSMSSIFSNTQ
ncbi:hypothetical protein MJD09_08190, partial [bacterium]|nr:hypothetical protein [bacterium]